MVGLSMLMASSGQTLEREDKPDDHMRIRPSAAHTAGVLRLVSVATALSHDVDHVVLASHTRTVVLTPVIHPGKGAAALSHAERRKTLLESVRSTDVTTTPPKHRWRAVVIAPGGATWALCNTDGPDEGDTLSQTDAISKLAALWSQEKHSPGRVVGNARGYEFPYDVDVWVVRTATVPPPPELDIEASRMSTDPGTPGLSERGDDIIEACDEDAMDAETVRSLDDLEAMEQAQMVIHRMPAGSVSTESQKQNQVAHKQEQAQQQRQVELQQKHAAQQEELHRQVEFQQQRAAQQEEQQRQIELQQQQAAQQEELQRQVELQQQHAA